MTYWLFHSRLPFLRVIRKRPEQAQYNFKEKLCLICVRKFCDQFYLPHYSPLHCVVQATEKSVATRLEPHHHVILENKYVTVMRVLIQPGESTLFHEQHLDYVNTHIEGSTVRIESPDKPVNNTEMKSSKVKFGAHQGKSDTDKVTNTGDRVNHEVAFEINMTGPQHFGGATRPASEAFTQVLNEKNVKGWKVSLKPGESTGTYTQHGPGVRSSLLGAGFLLPISYMLIMSQRFGCIREMRFGLSLAK